MNGESMKHQVAKVNAYKDRLLALLHLWLEMFVTIINVKDTLMVIAATNRLQLF